jgi:putative membrane protein
MPVLINLGRLLMLGVWAFLILNLVHPFPRPMNIFVNVALIFTSFMHALQMVMLKNGLPKDGPQMTAWQQVRVMKVRYCAMARGGRFPRRCVCHSRRWL